MKRALFETLGLFFMTAVLAQYDGVQFAIVRVVVLALGSIIVVAPLLSAAIHECMTSPPSSRPLPHPSRMRRI